MPKRILRNALLMAVATVLMAFALLFYIRSTGPVPGGAAGGALADGTYTSVQQGYIGDVTVTVTVTGGAVSAVEVDAGDETPALGGVAAEQLAEELAAAGSTAGVDIVAGSTFTSQAVLAGMDDCVAQASGGAAAGGGALADGTYTSVQQGYIGDVTVTVTVTGGAVSAVEVDAGDETPALGGVAAEQLAEELAAAGSTAGVDIVAGSTFTSQAVLAGMDDCVAQATAG